MLHRAQEVRLKYTLSNHNINNGCRRICCRICGYHIYVCRDVLDSVACGGAPRDAMGSAAPDDVAVACNVAVRGAMDSVVLDGVVSDGVALDGAMAHGAAADAHNATASDVCCSCRAMGTMGAWERCRKRRCQRSWRTKRGSVSGEEIIIWLAIIDCFHAMV